MPYDDRGPRNIRPIATAVGMIVLIVTIVAILTGLVWLFVTDANVSEPDIQEEMISAEPQIDSRYLSAVASELISSEGIDMELGNVTTYGDDPDVSLAEALNRRLPAEYVAVPIAADYVQFLPAPSIVWTAQDRVSKPVIFTSANESTVWLYDPEVGESTCGFTQFSRMYDAAGRHAVCIVSRGYSVEGEYRP